MIRHNVGKRGSEAGEKENGLEACIVLLDRVHTSVALLRSIIKYNDAFAPRNRRHPTPSIKP